MSEQTSLISPADRNSNYTPKGNIPSLENNQLVEAFQELNESSFTKFPRADRKYADPPLTNQVFGLHSFVPSKEAKPDKDGIYGMVKFRGTFSTEAEANERSEFLISTVDSYHTIYHSYIGRPFPLTTSSDFSADISEIEIDKRTGKIISDDIVEKRKKEKREIEEIKEKEKQLLEESERTESDPYEDYITMRVKKAQLIWTFIETQKKMDEMKKSIIKTREQLKEMDEEYPDYIKTYREKYMEARTNAGISDSDESFIKYLGEDLETELGF